MSRRAKLLRNIAIVTAGFIVVLAVGTIAVVQTDWFRNYVKRKIITATEEGTGGKAEVGSFSFDWRHLRAQVRNFVIHGLEPRDAAPLFRANLVQVAQRTRRLVSESAETVRHKQVPVYFDQMVDDVFLNGTAKADAPPAVAEKPADKAQQVAALTQVQRP